MCIPRATVSAVSCLVVPVFICIDDDDDDLLISRVLKINDDDDMQFLLQNLRKQTVSALRMTTRNGSNLQRRLNSICLTVMMMWLALHCLRYPSISLSVSQSVCHFVAHRTVDRQ